MTADWLRSRQVVRVKDYPCTPRLSMQIVSTKIGDAGAGRVLDKRPALDDNSDTEIAA
jgi:hypothetical protein